MLFIKDAGLSTDLNFGVENPIILNLRSNSTIAMKISTASRNKVFLYFLKLFKLLSAYLNARKLIASIGYILFTITISYIAQIP